MSEPPDDRTPADEIRTRLSELVSPFGGPDHHVRRERALAFLVDHADAAYPRLLAMIDEADGTGPVAALRALPLFDRAESTPVLADVLRRGSDAIVSVAADALAQQRDAGAEDVLLDALGDPRVAVVAAAADALRQRGATRACERLRRHLSAADPNVRFAIVSAAADLRCLQPAELTNLADHDPDEAIRQLAARLLES